MWTDDRLGGYICDVWDQQGSSVQNVLKSPAYQQEKYKNLNEKNKQLEDYYE